MGARTETTINNTRDFSIGKRLCDLPALRQVGFQANRRVLEVERLSQDCAAGEEAMLKLNRPVEVSGQRASALRITDLRVLALWRLLVWFRLLPCGFANRDLRAQLAVLTGQEPHHITQGRMTYDLRRLRLHGMIERIPRPIVTGSPTSASAPRCSSPARMPASTARGLPKCCQTHRPATHNSNGTLPKSTPKSTAA